MWKHLTVSTTVGKATWEWDVSPQLAWTRAKQNGRQVKNKKSEYVSSRKWGPSALLDLWLHRGFMDHYIFTCEPLKLPNYSLKVPVLPSECDEQKPQHGQILLSYSSVMESERISRVLWGASGGVRWLRLSLCSLTLPGAEVWARSTVTPGSWSLCLKSLFHYCQQGVSEKC